MSSTLPDHATILVHVIFSIRRQEHFIDNKIASLLYTCIEATLWEPFYSPALRTGGGTDHVHILLGLSRLVTADALIRGLKERSVAFIKSLGKKYVNFEWQEGYAAFTISRSEADDVKAYIGNQREFHRTTSFQNEYRSILTANGIEYDENEMWS